MQFATTVYLSGPTEFNPTTAVLVLAVHLNSVVRDVLGHDRTPEIDDARRKLLDEIDALVAESQAQTEA